MLPHDDDARRLSGLAYHFAEFFETFDIQPPTTHGRALLWGHCHQRATGGTDADQHLLERMGLDVQPLSGGCCGLAGSWGFEAGKYDISVGCGEQALLPAVRQADPDTVVVADGFSCQTQIADTVAGRTARHAAEVMALARGADHAGQPAPRPARRIVRTVGPAAATASLGAAMLWAAGRIVRRR
jgi:Fe-S oxidoreductase